jgi:hypothetical protein
MKFKNSVGIFHIRVKHGDENEKFSLLYRLIE